MRLPSLLLLLELLTEGAAAAWPPWDPPPFDLRRLGSSAAAWELVDPATAPTLFKVALTQKGYIQYLKYHVEVPELEDFTYCLWLRSDNFTHPQPIFSYSRHESERLGRGWLERGGGGGVLVRMALLEQPVMSVLTGIAARRWHHVCQGWSAARARWTLHLDGHLAATGVASHLRGLRLPAGGDLAVGQELTDSDRGLDDGIEGEVFGFNMALGGGAEAGRRLARLGHGRCALAGGAPLLAVPPPGVGLLVSWPRTPVAVFGGAVLRPASPVCGAF